MVRLKTQHPYGLHLPKQVTSSETSMVPCWLWRLPFVFQMGEPVALSRVLTAQVVL